jgi:hypothetical protein
MVQNSRMHLDHISYVTHHDQLADTVQRLGSLIGSPFVDGGIHPRFGTRNFTTPLKGSQYLEVVCPLDHPATELTPWGKAVTQKANEGGGWFSWVFSTNDISTIESRFGREAIDGHRTRPNGTDLKWKQIGVKEIAESRELPFFIQWLSEEHPSQDGTPVAKLEKILIADKDKLNDSWFQKEIFASLGDVVIEWIDPIDFDDMNGIVALHLRTSSGTIVLE